MAGGALECRVGPARRITFAGIAAFIALLMAFSGSAGSPETAQAHTERVRVIVRLKDEVARSTGEMRERLSRWGVETLREIGPATLLCAAPGGFSHVSSRNLPEVAWIEPEMTFRAAAPPPDDPDYPLQWNLGHIRAEGAWEKSGGGGPGVVVAIVDSGVAWWDSEGGQQAPDLVSTRILNGYDFHDDDPYPDDRNGHGTYITEIIASSFNNGFRAAGIAYDCGILPVKVLGKDGAGPSSAVAEGIYWAADHGAKVICLALASTAHSEAVGEAVRYAYQRGVLCVAAAGNEGSNPGYKGGMDCPADEGECVLAVGATDARKQRAHYSNYGEGLDLVAPGGDLTRDDNADGNPDGIPQEGFRLEGEPVGGFELIWKEGTSMATAQVAAAAAMLLSVRGAASPPLLMRMITSSCQDLGEAGEDDQYGSGLLDIPAALDKAVTEGRFFAEGNTLPGFETWFCLANPNTRQAQVTLEFFPEGGGVVQSGYEVPANTRLTLPVDSVLGEGMSFGTRVTSDLPVVAERPMYFDYKEKWRGGSDAAGAVRPSTTWYFAEGYTERDRFDTWLCMLNPWNNMAELKITYLYNSATPGTGPLEKTYYLDRSSRLTLNVNEEAGYDREVSFKVRSTLPIVAERPMYFDYKEKWDGGHDVVGATAPAAEWYFAEGTTRPGFETWLCLANPDPLHPAGVTVSYLMGEGQGPNVTRDYLVPAGTRRTIDVNADVGEGKDVSFKVRSTLPIVAERPMYFDYKEKWDGGHDVVGATAPAAEWYFAEGTTRPGFETWLCLANPQEEETARVTVEFLMAPEQGPNLTRVYEVPPRARRTLNVNEEAGPQKDLSFRIVSTLPVVAERPMYFLYRQEWAGGHCVLGLPGD